MTNPRHRKCPGCAAINRPYEVETCSKCGHVFLWRRSFGRKGYNRVVVYERTQGGPLWVRWWDRAGDNRETLTNLADVPITRREQAERIGKRMSEEQRSRRNRTSGLSQVLGLPERHTVGELFDQIHRDRSHEWSQKWARDQRRYRRFWETTLGTDTDLTQVTPGLVSRVLAKEAQAKEWSKKTQNHYLNAAVETWSYAQTHLKWIRPDQNLEAVRRHRIQVDNADIAYTQIEAEALCAVLSGIDLRAAVCAELSYVGGRRINAIRTLQTASYRTEDRILVLDGESMRRQFGVVTFPAKTDKARKKGEVYLWGHAKALLEELLGTPACRASGLLLPKLDLESSSVPDDPVTEKVLRSWLREAEAQAGVRSVRGRSYHGFNRAFATVAADPLAASGQSGKTLATLERYRQALPDEKAALAIQIDSLRRGA